MVFLGREVEDDALVEVVETLDYAESPCLVEIEGAGLEGEEEVEAAEGLGRLQRAELGALDAGDEVAVLRRLAEEAGDDRAEGGRVARPDGLAGEEAQEALEVCRFNQGGVQGLGEVFGLPLPGLAMEEFKAVQRLVDGHRPLLNEAGQLLFNDLWIQKRFVTHN